MTDAGVLSTVFANGHVNIVRTCNSIGRSSLESIALSWAQKRVTGPDPNIALARTVIDASSREASEGHLLPSDTPPPSPPATWPHISALLANAGHITVGYIATIDGAAVAADEHTVLATLVRRPDESVDGLLQRLDHAIGEALNHGIHTNEIDGGHFMLAGPRPQKGKRRKRK